MWWAEHAIMARAAALLCVLLLVKQRVGDVADLAVSQFPFWTAMFAFIAFGQSAPVEINAASNLIAAGTFASMAENRQAQRRHGIAQIYLCVLFLSMASLDGLYVLTPFSVYVILQEIGHYLALILIWGRAYVERMHGGDNNSLRQADNDTSGDVARPRNSAARWWP